MVLPVTGADFCADSRKDLGATPKSALGEGMLGRERKVAVLEGPPAALLTRF